MCVLGAAIIARRCANYPFVPAKAGIQFFLFLSLALGPRFRGDERMLIQRAQNMF
jgi:hypothetical protein